jgi:hypothetical protein
VVSFFHVFQPKFCVNCQFCCPGISSGFCYLWFYLVRHYGVLCLRVRALAPNSLRQCLRNSWISDKKTDGLVIWTLRNSFLEYSNVLNRFQMHSFRFCVSLALMFMHCKQNTLFEPSHAYSSVIFRYVFLISTNVSNKGHRSYWYVYRPVIWCIIE